MLKIINKIIELFNQEKDRRNFYINERKGRSFNEIYKTLTFEEKKNILHERMPAKGISLPVRFIEQESESNEPIVNIDYYFIVDCISYKMSFIVAKETNKIVYIEQIVEEVYYGETPSMLDFI